MADLYALAVTGHRPDKLWGNHPYPYGVDCQSRLVSFAARTIQEESARLCVEGLLGPEPSTIGRVVVITGMALGWDQAVAAACMRLNVDFDAYVPFDGQEAKWSWEMRQAYEYLLSRARRVVIVSPGGYAAWKLLKRNEAMVDASRSVLALWNGLRVRGGTAHAVEYAESIGRPITNCWRQWETFRG